MALSDHAEGNKFLQILPPQLRNPKQLKERFDGWVTKQPLALECAVATFSGSFQGGLMGAVMGSFSKIDPAQMGQASAQAGPQADLFKQMNAQMGGPWVQARNFAVMTGVNAGLALACRRIRKKDDAQGAMIAAFGSGACFSLVSGITQGNPFQGAFTTGVMFALLQGAFFKLGKKFAAPKKDSPEYQRARHLLTSIGYPEYSKNIQKGRLNDNTIWLWNDSALQEVRIPPGPRLLILSYIDRYRNVLKPAVPLNTRQYVQERAPQKPQ